MHGFRLHGAGSMNPGADLGRSGWITGRYKRLHRLFVSYPLLPFAPGLDAVGVLGCCSLLRGVFSTRVHAIDS